MTYISSKNNIPQEPHWVILTFNTIHIPGDERSRTDPGHGYPARDETTITYQAFESREELEKEVRTLEGRAYKPSYVAGYFTPATIKSTIEIQTEIKCP